MFNLVGWQAKLGEWLIGFLLIAGMTFWVYHKGELASDERWQVAQAQSNQLAQAKYDKAASQLETVKAQRIVETQVVTKIVTKLVDRPIYQNVCLDNDGLNIINKALSGDANETPK